MFSIIGGRAITNCFFCAYNRVYFFRKVLIFKICPEFQKRDIEKKIKIIAELDLNMPHL
jgi:hypothetical protein